MFSSTYVVLRNYLLQTNMNLRIEYVYFYSIPSGTNKQSFSDCTSTTNDTTLGRNNGSSSPSNLCTTGTLKSQQELLQEQVTFLQKKLHCGFICWPMTYFLVNTTFVLFVKCIEISEKHKKSVDYQN